MQINRVQMTRASYQTSPENKKRMVVLHSTAGLYSGDYGWLRQGGSTTDSSKRVSCHYYIRKTGEIIQFVEDKHVAWHCGDSRWTIDGQAVRYCNPYAIGIELENKNTGNDSYPQAQYDATLWLTRKLVATYKIPRSQLVRHLDIAPGRKTDPRGFPWERFVAEVYQQPVTPTVDPTPTPEPFPVAKQFRLLLVDLAYRAAGSSRPYQWPLLKDSISKKTGMPVYAITPPTLAGENEIEEGDSRAVLVNGQSFILEAYGGDLLYAPSANPSQIQRLSATAEPLRTALLNRMFREADPKNGYREWTNFHQFYKNNIAALGVPIGPDHVLPLTAGNGVAYSCQHFSLDTLCWDPVGKRRVRLSELTRDMYGADQRPQADKTLRNVLLTDLYNYRTQTDYKPDRLFTKHAIMNGLGAPLSRAEYIRFGTGPRLVAMPFALDVLFARVPDDGDWDGVTVGNMTDLGLGSQNIARLSAALEAADLDA